ncbi:MAG: transposase [Cyanobacteria bacterium P01_H01_bin.121]
MEKALRPQRLNELFEQHAQEQYTRELLFSNLVNLMSLVVCGICPSVNAAYRVQAQELNVTRNAVYSKLNGVELQVSAALLRTTAQELGELVATTGGALPPALEGYQVRILDGNALAATERRLAVLRSVAAAPLPGKSLVVLDPHCRLAVDIFPCEDGHAQERRLFPDVLQTVQTGQLWLADRNMCTVEFLLGIVQRQADFVIREHKNLPQQAVRELQFVGRIKGGELWEQPIEMTKAEQCLPLRRLVLRFDKPNRHGDTEIVVLTSLPTAITAAVVMALYRQRWQVEGLFLTVTQNFEGEIKTLTYPKAALFSFSLALVAYNILATLKAALASVHGVGKIEAALSDFYVVDELQATYRGMMIAIPPSYWQDFQAMPLDDLADLLKHLALRVNIKRFLKQPRKQKQKKPPLISDPQRPHVSTAKLLAQD